MPLPQIIPAKPRRRRKRRQQQLPAVAPTPPPPSGARVISVHYDPDSEHTIWTFDSIILNVTDDPTAYLAIAGGFRPIDWDGFEENALFTYYLDGDGNPPGPGDLWTATANDIIQTEQGGVLAGSGTMS